MTFKWTNYNISRNAGCEVPNISNYVMVNGMLIEKVKHHQSKLVMYRDSRSSAKQEKLEDSTMACGLNFRFSGWQLQPLEYTIQQDISWASANEKNERAILIWNPENDATSKKKENLTWERKSSGDCPMR